MLRIGVDVGGTFTDVVVATEDRTAIVKVPSTPGDYGLGIVEGVRAGLRRAGLELRPLDELVHGTTVATNAILEGRGARTALITTNGFRDLLEIRRMRLPKLYDTLWVKPKPLVERALRLEVDERIEHTGEVLRPLDEGSVACAIDRLRVERVEAIAVCLLHSYVNPSHERRVGEMVRAALPDAYVSLSSEVLPRIREYERTSTTVINAYIGPIVDRYLAGLGDGLKRVGAPGPVLVMQSNGGVMSAAAVRRRPAFAVESGPAGGVIAAARLTEDLGIGSVITLDMGGTTAKSSSIEGGALAVTSECEVGAGVTVGNRLNRGGGYLLSVPAIDICEVGAGGGSIATIDPGGGLRVGPESAGAEPGPACYARGGTKPTLTDANVVLGLLPRETLLGGALAIDAAQATAAIEREIAQPLGVSLDQAAWAIRRLAIASMVRVVRAVSSERGRDPRDFTLVAFGGNGPLHGAAVADEMGIGRVVVPPNPGLFSAVGLLRARREHHFEATHLVPIDRIDVARFEALFADLEAQALRELGDDDLAGELHIERHAELRYVGQSFELRIPVESDSPTELAARFEAEHARRYGHSFPGDSVEIVTLAIVARGPEPVALREPVAGAPAPASRCTVFDGGSRRDVPVRGRGDIDRATQPGPLIVEEYDATTFVPEGWAIRRDGAVLVLER